ncbi:hypothetical protein [Streptomyces sp. NPDC056240]|uniref:hypothetical protein n=1 Tax=Streptomyces sp. NPDC056240 TaxID=3345759 RepID=UPI0035DD22BD
MASKQQTRPGIGDLANDSAKERIGIVIGEIGGCVQMRPIDGGDGWDAIPDKVVPLSARKELSARLAVKNNNSQVGL